VMAGIDLLRKRRSPNGRSGDVLSHGIRSAGVVLVKERATEYLLSVAPTPYYASLLASARPDNEVTCGKRHRNRTASANKRTANIKDSATVNPNVIALYRYRPAD